MGWTKIIGRKHPILSCDGTVALTLGETRESENSY